MLCVIKNEDCLETMEKLPEGCVDLTVTSPPYDNLRTYNGFTFDFPAVAQGLYRVTKPGGVVVWVVGDATINGSETGTSFRQALYFKEIGFNLHDTMIWRKTNPTPTDPRIGRYTQSFEYMFIFAKGKVAKHNLQRTPCKTAGAVRKAGGNPSQLRANGTRRDDRAKARAGQPVKDDKIMDNVWAQSICVISNGHPAPFPEALANDHIVSWSNEGDLVYDPFLGSGTTAKMALLNKRRFVGSEISAEYCEIARKRVAPLLEEEV